MYRGRVTGPHTMINRHGQTVAADSVISVIVSFDPSETGTNDPYTHLRTHARVLHSVDIIYCVLLYFYNADILT